MRQADRIVDAVTADDKMDRIMKSYGTKLKDTAEAVFE